MNRKGILNILFWSVISAAFIGPGTVTTAAKSGALYGGSLLWALAFSVLATILLQELAARLTITTGLNLGQHLRQVFSHVPLIPGLIWFALVFGCAAYEAGNITGAVAGISTAVGLPRFATVLIVSVAAFLILSRSRYSSITRIMGLLVAVMGVMFIIVSIRAGLQWSEVLKGSLVPRVPAGSLLLVIALVGTTVVPYNLFLGSGISHGQELKEMRRGLIPAVIIGGIISAAILVSGNVVKGEFSFESLAAGLENTSGQWARYVFGTGLLAAGLTSAVTAPLAAAITSASIFPGWKKGSRAYQATWLVVLLIGVSMSLLDFRPVSVIIAAQALNGVLLPVIAVALLEIVLKKWDSYPALQSHIGFLLLTIGVVAVAVFLGTQSFLTAADRIPFLHIDHHHRLMVSGAVAATTFTWQSYRVYHMLRA